ncbi:MAG: hypothetical protein QF384_08405 [Alphaproteobacteria bacterium]|nr:hypothetical protein [Alphaproteobacteria bacterium]MDP6874126.1 hypothetical protein [Alphaproteobacteria bacterium]
MPKALVFAIVGVFLSTSALAGSGCFGVSHSDKTASTSTQSTTTAETPAPTTTKPESKG